jgi:uncharacterized membrane protein
MATSVNGVLAVNNRLWSYKPLETMPTQEPKLKHPLDIMQARWTPATRVMVGAIGGHLIVSGFRAGVLRGALSRLVGLALIVRAVTNVEFKAANRGFNAETRADDMRNIINIQRPHNVVRKIA